MIRPWLRAFSVEGLNTERFCCLAAQRGILLQNVARPTPRSLTAAVREDRLPNLVRLAEQGGWALVPGERLGMGRTVKAMYARRILPAGVLAALLVLLVASRFVWRIHIVDGGAYQADLAAALTELGVTPPLRRSQIDLGELRDALEWRYPRIAWVECGFRGVTLVIRPVMGVLPHETPENGPCDVVAARDGVVHTVVTRAGTPVVQPGDTVRQGDVLIRGEERTSDGLLVSVAARGSVTARVWAQTSVRMRITQVESRPTGREQTMWTVRTPLFDLWPMGESGFAHQDIATTEMPLLGLFIPVTLHIERRIEADFVSVPGNAEEICASAEAAAVRKLHEKIGSDESIIDIWGNCSMIDDENVYAIATAELLTEIGVQTRSSDMAVPDNEQR